MLDDLRTAVRSLQRHFRTTLLALTTLTIAAGINLCAFQLYDALQLRALPVPAPQALREIYLDRMTNARGTWLRSPALTNALWEAIRDDAAPFSGVMAWADDVLDVSADGRLTQISGLWVSGGAFDVLDLKPAAGRLFTAADDVRGCGVGSAVISYAFWMRQFGGAPIVGSTVPLGIHQVRVIGITPKAFTGLDVGSSFDVAMPLCAATAWFGSPARLDSGTLWWLSVVGRLKPGVSPAGADAFLQSRSSQIFASTLPPGYPAASVKPYLGMTLTSSDASRGRSQFRDRYATSLTVFLVFTSLLFLIACLNLTHLILVRAEARRREAALRLALGLSRLRLVRQFVLENLVLALVGVFAGLLAAPSLVRSLLAFLSTSHALVFLDAAISAQTIAYAAGLAAMSTVTTTLLPVMRGAITPGEHSLLNSRTEPVPSGRARRAVLASQFAISLVLIAGALLFGRTLRGLSAVAPGFTTDGVTVATITFSETQPFSGQNADRRRQFLERVTSLGASAAEVMIVPLTSGNWSNQVSAGDASPDQTQAVYRNMIGPAYFRTMQTPILQGREFVEADALPDAPHTAIVNLAFARALGLGADAVGQGFWVDQTSFEPRTRYDIVGLVADTKYRDLREPFRPIFFVPLSAAALGRNVGQFVIRSGTSDVDTLAAEMRGALGTSDSAQRFTLQPLGTIGSDQLGRERLMVAASTPLALLAMLLAAVGLYGIAAQTIAERRSELGIRAALGATDQRLVMMIVRESAGAALIGIIAGGALALWSGRSLASLLFDVSPSDPWSLVGTALALGVIAIVSSYVPARRAMRQDPIRSLTRDGAPGRS